MAQQFQAANFCHRKFAAQSQRRDDGFALRPAHDEGVQRTVLCGEADVVGREVFAVAFIEGVVSSHRRGRVAGDLPGTRAVDAFAVHRHPPGDLFHGLELLVIRLAAVGQRNVEHQVAVAADNVAHQVHHVLAGLVRLALLVMPAADAGIGGWHYKKGQTYKTGKNVVDLMCDIVSRKGNLILNVPLPNSGKPDDEELKTVEEITRWMAVNSEGIYGTRPWKVAGNADPPVAGNTAFNERNRKDLTANDVRFTTTNGTLYAFVMGWPEHEAVVPTLALGGKLAVAKIRGLELLGQD